MGEDYLSHHGIKGMRWGIRNEETRERYARDGTSSSGSFRKKHGDSIAKSLVSAGSRLMFEAPTVAKAAAMGASLNLPAVAVSVGTAAVLTYTISEVQKTEAYAKGMQKVTKMLSGTK